MIFLFLLYKVVSLCYMHIRKNMVKVFKFVYVMILFSFSFFVLADAFCKLFSLSFSNFLLYLLHILSIIFLFYITVTYCDTDVDCVHHECNLPETATCLINLCLCAFNM